MGLYCLLLEHPFDDEHFEILFVHNNFSVSVVPEADHMVFVVVREVTTVARCTQRNKKVRPHSCFPKLAGCPNDVEVAIWLHA